MTATEIKIDDQEIKQELSTFSRGITCLRVTDQSTYDAAAHLLLEIKNRTRKVSEFFSEAKATSYATWKRICGMENDAMKPLAEAERHLKTEISRWITEQERIRREAERLERERIERERLESLERDIEAAERDGASAQEIAAICEMPMAVAAPPPPAPTYQKATGVSTRQTYKAEVTDLKLLCGAIARGEVPTSYVTANLTSLNARARADGMMLQIPGVRVVVEAGVAVRTKF